MVSAWAAVMGRAAAAAAEATAAAAATAATTVLVGLAKARRRPGSFLSRCRANGVRAALLIAIGRRGSHPDMRMRSLNETVLDPSSIT